MLKLQYKLKTGNEYEARDRGDSAAVGVFGGAAGCLAGIAVGAIAPAAGAVLCAAGYAGGAAADHLVNEARKADAQRGREAASKDELAKLESDIATLEAATQEPKTVIGLLYGRSNSEGTNIRKTDGSHAAIYLAFKKNNEAYAERAYAENLMKEISKRKIDVKNENWAADVRTRFGSCDQGKMPTVADVMTTMFGSQSPAEAVNDARKAKENIGFSAKGNDNSAEPANTGAAR
jgi:hypothetical protein